MRPFLARTTFTNRTCSSCSARSGVIHARSLRSGPYNGIRFVCSCADTFPVDALGYCYGKEFYESPGARCGGLRVCFERARRPLGERVWRVLPMSSAALDQLSTEKIIRATDCLNRPGQRRRGTWGHSDVHI